MSTSESSGPRFPTATLPASSRPDLSYVDEIVLAASIFGATPPRYFVPGERWIRLNSAALTLVTVATVATRVPQLQLFDPNSIALVAVPAANGQTASQSVTYTWFPSVGQPFGALNTNQTAPWPNLWIPPLWQVAIAVPAGQNGDQVGPLVLYVEVVPSGPRLAEPALEPTPLVL